MKRFTEFATREALMQAAASYVAEALEHGISERGEGCAALSGGGTPEPAYRALAAMPLDWRKVTFLLVDERFVPPTHADSNEAMLRRALAPALTAGARLAPMFADGASLEEAANRADAAYAKRRIDVAVMGMGEDGHTASWFRQSPELAAALDLENPRTVMAVHAPGAAGSSERLTITRAAIAAAARRLLLITGGAKRSVLANAEAPVMALLESAPTATFWAA